MELTDHQKYVLFRLVKGVREELRIQQTLGGYAGTGKTTLIKYLRKFFPKFAVAAYTGKAANILRKKGISASTIHSLIYRPVYVDNHLAGFEVVPGVEFEHEGIIIDEASMVSEEIYSDLMSYDLPTVFVGDHGQLEPIKCDFNLMREPDYRLEEIHRNSGDIPRFAERLRFGYRSTSFRPETDRVQFLDQNRVSDDDLMSVDQIICAYNNSRVNINNRVRAIMGLTGKVQVGDKIMCLKNNRLRGLFNGMQGIVKALYEDDGRPLLDFEFDNTLYSGIWYDTAQFGKEKPDFECYGRDYAIPFDYAYAITAHKAQGDEFESVLVYEQRCQLWDHKRWTYTAASRAKERLKWAC